MTLAERYNATLLESARLLENADRLAVHNSALRAQLAAEVKEHDEARRAIEAHGRTITGLRNSNAILAAQLADATKELSDLKRGLHPDGSGKYDSYLVARERLQECQAENARLRAAIAPLFAALTSVIGEVRDAAETDAAWCAVADAYHDATAIAARAGAKL